MTTQKISNFIGNQFAESKARFERISPIDPSKIFSVPDSTKVDVDLAVSAALGAQPAWAALGVEGRIEIVGRMADWLVERYGEAGEETPTKRIIMEAMGKPLPEADVEVIETSDFITAFCVSARETLVSETPSLDKNLWPSKASEIHHVPLGVVGIIKPWNYPLEMIAWSAVPAILAGNAVVIKPSEKAPSVANLYAEMALACGLPEGVLNIVYGGGAVGEALASHSNVALVSFTGSVAAVKSVAQNCAKRLGHYSLELGGNDAAIVLPDADVNLAANGLIWGAFCNAGQVCVGIKRAYIHASIYEDVLELLRERLGQVRPLIDVGPIVDQAQFNSVQSYLDDAVTTGASIVRGVDTQANALYFPPAIVRDLAKNARLLTEECFGPILPVESFEDVNTVIGEINNSKYGLGASVWGSSNTATKSVAEQLSVGMVWINDVNVAFPQSTWGGRRNSGGFAELGRNAILNFTFPKHVNNETASEDRRAWWFPY
jgi:acyl-CoA reductase-like NAD-dependent aldehyde dehydrogenase